jgi:predicted KAP-like P-loop ATPase
MKLRLNEVPIPNAGKPFENCKLDREKYAFVLTKIIETYSEGFVLGLNNRWGEGKTTFIRMWKIHLGNQGFKTLYFNAWEHDFNNDPLSAILSELKSLEIYDKQKFAPLIKRGAKLTASLVPILMGALAEKYIDTKSIKDAFQTLSEEAASIFEEEVNEYANKKRGLDEFKKDLQKYVSKIDKKPLIFFIDELDRCNPKYAVELLEIVKHFFTVPGIVFIVSTDKKQLSNSIKGYFGSEDMDSEEYLRRFFDLEYTIPKPDMTSVIDWMLEKYSFKQLEQNIQFEEYRFLRKLAVEYFKKLRSSNPFCRKIVSSNSSSIGHNQAK